MDTAEVESLIDDLHWDKPVNLRRQAIKKLQEIDDGKLEMLIMPRNKPYWDSAAEVLMKIGYPRVGNVLPNLLVWLQDINWPGSPVIADLLKSVGQPLIPSIKTVLKGKDVLWQYWITEYIIEDWPIYIVSQLKDELISLANKRDEEELYMKAKNVLSANNLLRNEE